MLLLLLWLQACTYSPCGYGAGARSSRRWCRPSPATVAGRRRRRGRRRRLKSVACRHGAVPALPRPKRPPEARKRAPVVPFGRTPTGYPDADAVDGSLRARGWLTLGECLIVIP